MNNTIKKRTVYFLIITLALIVILAIIVALLANNLIRIPCVFYELFKIKCPGCGNTRAALSLIKLDLKSAIKYNYLFPLEFIYLAYLYLATGITYIKTGKLNYKTISIYIDISVLIILIVWAIVRNICSL